MENPLEDKGKQHNQEISDRMSEGKGLIAAQLNQEKEVEWKHEKVTEREAVKEEFGVGNLAVDVTEVELIARGVNEGQGAVEEEGEDSLTVHKIIESENEQEVEKGLLTVEISKSDHVLEKGKEEQQLEVEGHKRVELEKEKEIYPPVEKVNDGGVELERSNTSILGSESEATMKKEHSTEMSGDRVEYISTSTSESKETFAGIICSLRVETRTSGEDAGQGPLVDVKSGVSPACCSGR